METKALREKLRDYTHVIVTMHCGLVAEDLEGNIQFVNQRLLDWLGYEREELLGDRYDKLGQLNLTTSTRHHRE